jgi:hypothetical protein
MSDTPNDPRWPGQQPDDPDSQTDLDDDDFDESAYDTTNQRRFLSGKRLVGVAIAAVVLIGAGAAFALTRDDSGGGGDDDTASGDGRSGDNPMADAAFEYAECMREHGIEDFPDPQIEANGEGVSIGADGGAMDAEDPEFQAADEACQPIMEEAMDEGGPSLTPEEQAERQDMALAMAQCMRDRGWDFPDPEVDEHGGIGIRVEEGNNMPAPEDPDFEQFEQDQQECNEEAGMDEPPGGGQGGGGGEGPSNNTGGEG